jgi:hypothetical protein
MSDSPAAVLFDSGGNAAKYFVLGADYVPGTHAVLYDASGNPAKYFALGADYVPGSHAVIYDASGNPAKFFALGADYVPGTHSVPYDVDGNPVKHFLLGSDYIPGAHAVLYDSSGKVLEVESGVAIPANTRGVLVHGKDGSGDARVAEFLSDAGVYRLRTEIPPNLVDSNNSSTSQLSASGTFIGTGTDVSGFATVAVTVHSDKDSAVDGMKFEFSMDNSNWDDSYSFNLDASSSQTRRFQFPVCAQYFRVNYTNGSEVTTQFRVQTILHKDNILTSIHRTEDVVKTDRSAQLMKAALIAQREGASIQDFYPIQSDVSGNLKVTTIGTDIPSDPAALVLQFTENGGSGDLLVDGSSTPVNFDQGPTVTNEVWSVRELLLVFASDDFYFDGSSFGPNTLLTNGISINVIRNSVTTEVFNITQNEDFLRLPGRPPLVSNTGPKDVLSAALSFQGLVLDESTSDVIRVIVRDDLTSVKFQYMTATLFAVKVE